MKHLLERLKGRFDQVEWTSEFEDLQWEDKKGEDITWINNGWDKPSIMKRHEYKHPITQQLPNRMNLDSSQNTLIIKLLKDNDKERNLKEATEKWFITYKASSIRFSADFSSETLEAIRQQADILIQSVFLKNTTVSHMYSPSRSPLLTN